MQQSKGQPSTTRKKKRKEAINKKDRCVGGTSILYMFALRWMVTKLNKTMLTA